MELGLIKPLLEDSNTPEMKLVEEEKSNKRIIKDITKISFPAIIC